jgi:hypothetical protein
MRFQKISTIVLFLLSSLGVAGQSTNPSSPTPLNGSYTGKGPSDETNYYFNFTGGPGKVSVKLEIKAKDYSTFARLEIGNDPSNLIAMANMNASTTTGASSVTKEFELSKKQSVRIKVTLDGNLAEYTLSLNGDNPTFTSGKGNSGNSTGVKAGSAGNLGKLLGSSGSKPGFGSANGGKPKTQPQDTDGDGVKERSFTCPNEVIYSIVPTAGWSAGISSQKRYLFTDADVVENLLVCSYNIVGPDNDSATIQQNAPLGYKCEVFKGGSKSRDIVCKRGQMAGVTAPRRREVSSATEGK